MKALYGKTSGESGEVGSDVVFIRILPSIVELNKNVPIQNATNDNEQCKSPCLSLMNTKYQLNRKTICLNK